MSPDFSEQDTRYMARALQLARRGRYTTDPNPRVGCVLVNNGQVVGEGWHQWAGQGHAEVLALAEAGSTARGATAYVTLEPCSHFGQTPPCAHALVQAGVGRVVAAMPDPNPLVSGRGLASLSAAGIETAKGLLAEEAEALNRGFCLRMRRGRPFVFSKLAMSLDGRTALASGESQWITGAEARADVHRLRAASSAIVTGIDTVLADDPRLTARLGDTSVAVQQPLRVILDTRLRMPLSGQLAQLPGRTLILTGCDEAHRQHRLKDAGFEVVTLALNAQGRMDPAVVVDYLGQQGCNEVMLEAGATLNGAWLNARLLDELVVYQAFCVLGDTGRGLFHLPGLMRMDQKIELKLLEARAVSCDIRLRLQPVCT